ncbi:hypothetical protein EUGRSUZ_G01498 [Eucalyptus grandis]|uniref:Uncharacterized protein n=2 Tax=Eucalyptus grandis TaxID=71139 RepID=A0ACC3K2M6_EUCGR|nr:hypothetical protein EUGRSUZ_G01498 [Eucalyptus grandis]
MGKPIHVKENYAPGHNSVNVGGKKLILWSAIRKKQEIGRIFQYELPSSIRGGRFSCLQEIKDVTWA